MIMKHSGVVYDLIVIKRIRSKFRSPDKMIDVRFFDFNLKLIRQDLIAVERKLPDSSYFCYAQELDTIFLVKWKCESPTATL